MNVIKKDGKQVAFDLSKIKRAIERSNKETQELTEADVLDVVNVIHSKLLKITREISSKEIQKLVEDTLMRKKFYETARSYIEYRYQKELDKKQNTTDSQILNTVNLENEEVKQENSNKNPTINSTQRDYIAGLVSKDLTNRYLLPKDIQDAHNAGIIHFHDADYFVQRMHNCCVWNLEDMLQNGTVINGVKIEKPHSFITACTIATQISAIVASSQYGGQTISLSHLAPFVDISRQKIRADVEREIRESHIKMTKVKINKIVEDRVRKEIKDGVQTMQYQILTLNSTNG